MKRGFLNIVHEVHRPVHHGLKMACWLSFAESSCLKYPGGLQERFFVRKLSREGPSWESMKKELELFAFSCDKYVSGLWTHKELFEGQGQVMFRVERCGLGSTFQWNWLICLEVF